MRFLLGMCSDIVMVSARVRKVYGDLELDTLLCAVCVYFLFCCCFVRRLQVMLLCIKSMIRKSTMSEPVIYFLKLNFSFAALNFKD